MGKFVHSGRWAVGVVILALAGLTVGCEPQAPARVSQPVSRTKTLTIVSPHSAEIRQAFELGFTNYHYLKTGKNGRDGEIVRIHWIARGTPECRAYVEQVAASLGAERRLNADIMFGGGVRDHALLADENLSVAVKLDDLTKDIPAEVAGVPTRDAEGRWYATGLSSFGILYNKGALAQRDIAPPATWDDLADPRFFSWLAIADPAASGSHRECMVLMLQKYGFEDGWSRIIRMLGNSRALVERSSSALQQTRNGVFLASFAVNFDGLHYQHISHDGCEYVDPADATVATPDVISVLSTTTDRKLAEAFVRYCLSDEGQLLWCSPTNIGGSEFRLYHYPINPAVYTKHADKLEVDRNPFETQYGIQYDVEKAAGYASVVTPMVQAACGENHVLLQRAWRALIDAGMPADALKELTAPPVDDATALKLSGEFESAADGGDAVRAEWSKAFAEKYRKVLAMLGK